MLKFYRTLEVCLLVMGLVGLAPGNTLKVPVQYATIQAAIDAASPGDTVLVAPGTYNENLLVYKDLSLVSASPLGATLEGVGSSQDPHPVIEVRYQSPLISGFRVLNGTGKYFCLPSG